MTLESIPPYDPHAVSRLGTDAVVVGGGIAGLLAARVLADAYTRVTILERDNIESEHGPRPGVPQAKHVHALLEAGRATLDDLFPGYTDAIRTEGGVLIDAASDFEYHHQGDVITDGIQELPMLCASRPCFERVIRQRLLQFENVEMVTGAHFQEFCIESTSNGVGYATYRRCGSTHTIEGDLFVDATGRTSRTPGWLESNGFDVPSTQEVEIDLTYATTRIPRPSEDRRGYLVGPAPSNPRGGTAIPIEGDEWIVTLFGLHDAAPSTHPDNFVEFAGRLPTEELRVLLTETGNLSRIYEYPFPSSRRHRYERLRNSPSRLLVIGDAIASFNPIYGQGMSVATLDALHLHHELARCTSSPNTHRYFDRVGETLDVIWGMTVSADFGFPQTNGPRPLGTGCRNWYLRRVIRTAHTDPVVADAFARVLRLEVDPTTLFEPSILARVVLPNTMLSRIDGTVERFEPPT